MATGAPRVAARGKRSVGRGKTPVRTRSVWPRPREVGSRGEGLLIDFNILGPLEIRDPDGPEIRLPAGRERSLLALLLIHRGTVVSTDRIIEVLWGERPPGTATKAMQGYISHLRRELGGDSGDARALLVTQPPGYVLRADAVVRRRDPLRAACR